MKREEISAYTTEAGVNEAFRVDNSHGIWTNRVGWRPASIEYWAEESTRMGWRTTTRSTELMLLLLAALVGCLALTCRAPETKEPKATTICSIASNPALDDGDLVKVRAIVRSDGSHYTVLYDPSCLEAGGLALVEGPDDRQSDVRALRDVLPVGEPVLPGTEIRGTFIGKFRSRSTGRPPKTIELVKASDVTKRLPKKSRDTN